MIWEILCCAGWAIFVLVAWVVISAQHARAIRPPLSEAVIVKVNGARVRCAGDILREIEGVHGFVGLEFDDGRRGRAWVCDGCLDDIVEVPARAVTW